MTLALVLLAGAIGAASRYAVESAVSARVRSRWPWGTFTVNVTGCFALGLLAGTSPQVRTVLGVGLVGAYTTFSAYAVEIVRTDADVSRRAAVAYGVGSVVAGVLAAGLGVTLAR